MTALVTLEEAKRQLKIEPTDHDRDEEIDLKIEAASAIVLRYIKVPASDWTNYLPAPDVQVATLLMIADLFDGCSELSIPAKAILLPLRVLTMA